MPGNMTLEQQIESAVSHHRAGRLAEAEAIYRQILSVEPDDPDVLHLLGVIVNQTGRHEEAIDLIGRAVELDGDYAEAHFNLGHAFADSGRFDRAIACYERAIQLRADYVEAHFNLGDALLKAGRLDEAIAALKRAVQLKPDDARTYNNLGIALAGKGRDEEAIAAYRRALELKPDFAEAQNNIGEPLKKTGHLDDAVASYRRAIQLKPDFAEAQGNLGGVLADTGDFKGAIAACRQAIRLNPNYPQAYFNLGNSLFEDRQLEQAVASYQRAILLKPDYAEAYDNLGNALVLLGRPDAAIASLERAIQLRPDFAEAHSSLGNALKDKGEIDRAIASYRRAVAIAPQNAKVHSNLAYAMYFDAACTAEEVLGEHRRWNQQHAEPLRNLIRPHANDRDPNRRLRIGYVSADFRNHSVSRFLLPLFRRHDRGAYEITCYSNNFRCDTVTDHLRACADGWRNTAGLSDERMAEMVREDKIDILVDLGGHTAGNRLRVFAQKPAPVQVNYLGYPGTTGLAAMDYRLTDAFADPPGSTESLHSEKLVRLPVCGWCYGEPDDAPAVGPLPAGAGGPICFGTFNNFAKVSPAIIDLWAAILMAMPSSRMLIKFRGLGEESVRVRIHQSFESRGVRPERVEIRGHEPNATAHLDAYNQLDIALDTFPYHGTTTTCEALWMGVPVISLAGQRHVSRVGVSLLSNVGLPELIAQTPEQYVRIATDLAKDLPRLAELRRTLRARMQASPLMNAPRFARDIEAAYRQMWRNWCEAGEDSSLQCPAG
jgi:predicted O-linked N-acetylglucosamine transferase (SPINDLY family)